MNLQGLFDDVAEIGPSGQIAAGVEHGSAELREFIRECGADAAAQFAVGKNGDAGEFAVGRETPRDDARLVLRQQRELEEIGRGAGRIAEEIQREHRRAAGAQGRDGGHVLFG